MQYVFSVLRCQRVTDEAMLAVTISYDASTVFLVFSLLLNQSVLFSFARTFALALVVIADEDSLSETV